MNYYSVLVATNRYKSASPLTYSYDASLDQGTLVVVQLKEQKVLGVIQSKLANKPSFSVKPIVKIVSNSPLPSWYMPLANWIAAYYATPISTTLSSMLPSSLLQQSRSKQALQSPSRTENNKTEEKLPPLTTKQLAALKKINTVKNQPVLLHGVTGSGKTRLYLELATQAILDKKSVFVLTPEIGLTPQLVETFKNQFGNLVCTTHSHMTPAERRDIWLGALESKTPLIVIGPRSALFLPLENVELIIVDECHDGSYKQEQMPQYHAVHVAATLRKITKATLVLGSATPNIQDYYTFLEKKLPIVTLLEKAMTAKYSVKHHVVDTSNRKQFSSSHWISNPLIKSISASLSDNHQSLLFLNRRGTAKLILCQSCQWSMECPKCDLPLTYHDDNFTARCHTCGFKTAPPTTCPNCKGSDIIMKTLGTKALTGELAKLFPSAKVARFDSDNETKDNLHEQYKQLHSGEIDIFIGTQIVSKGLDLPKLRTIGIIQADSSLLFPDYTAEEQAFQQLSQLIGRVGRGHTSGEIVLQTHHPDNPLFSAVLNQDYSTFYKKELHERKTYNFPPFCYILKITVSRAKEAAAKTEIEKIATSIKKLNAQIEILGPAPAFKTRTHDKYHWHIVLKTPKRQNLLRVVSLLPPRCKYEIDPLHLL